MWIEVLKSGTHIASDGQKKTFSISDLDRIIESYDPAFHEAPVVIGHPKDNEPAYGWVEALKRQGNTLMAKLKDLVPEFVQAVRQGMFKKRSISLYPNLMLRHVGFLGAVPPAVKGLAPVAFRDSGPDYLTIELTEEEPSAGIRMAGLTKAIMEERGIAYGLAFYEAQKLDPDLAREYQSELFENRSIEQ